MKNTLNVTTSDDREIIVTREFDAPRDLVWEAMSRPELIKRWVSGPSGWEMTVCEEDPRVGGTFLWAWSGPDGAAMTMRGEYHEIVPPERVSRTEIFDIGCGTEGAEQFATLVLADKGRRTGLTITLRYASREARDGAVASGMTQGMAAGYDRLDEILAGVAA